MGPIDNLRCKHIIFQNTSPKPTITHPNSTRSYPTAVTNPEKVRPNSDSARHCHVHTSRCRGHQLYRRQNNLVTTIKEPKGNYPFSSTTNTNYISPRSTRQQRRHNAMPTITTPRFDVIKEYFIHHDKD